VEEKRFRPEVSSVSEERRCIRRKVIVSRHSEQHELIACQPIEKDTLIAALCHVHMLILDPTAYNLHSVTLKQE